MACYCCVSGCNNNNHKATTKHFFRFPKNDEKRQKLWRRFTRKNVRATAVICEDHFETKYMIQKDKKLKLTSKAVPTIFFNKSLGFDGQDYFGSEAEEMNKANEMFNNEQIVAIETAFVNEQLKLDELKARCRFCAEAKEDIIEISSFASYNVNIEMFLQILDLRIVESDFFPNSVCEECFNQVLLIDSFIVKCKAADQRFWEEVGKLKTITAAIVSPIKSADLSQEKLREESMDHDGETDYRETMNQSYEEIIQECDTENDETNETDSMFTVDFMDAESIKSASLQTLSNERSTNKSEEKSKPKTDKGNLPTFAIMDPSCNKFAMKSYSCEICLKLFAGQKTYKNHICDVPEIRCVACGDVFNTVFALKTHRRHLHSDNLQRNFCPICKMVITGNPTVFKKHKTKCNRDRIDSIQCDACQKVTRIKFNCVCLMLIF